MYTATTLPGIESICKKEVKGKQVIPCRILFNKKKGVKSALVVYEYIDHFKFKKQEEVYEKFKNLKIKIKSSFKVECNREGKHKFGSREICEDVGEIFYEQGYMVNLKNPETVIYVDIKDEGDTAMGYGFGGKIGVLLTPMSNMKIGLSYSTPSYLNKLEGKTQMYKNAQNFSNGKNMVVPMKSDVAMDFQWPMSFAAGLSYNPLSNLTLAFDVNWLNWSATMDKMEFEFTNNEFMAEDFGVMKYTEIKGKFLFTMPQKWEDQLVFKVGAEYKMLDDNLSLRAGFNYGSNPVPDDYLNFLMGAVVTTHVTAGIGYNLLDWFSTDISYVYVPEAESGNPKTSGLYKMSENNIQFMVSSVF